MLKYMPQFFDFGDDEASLVPAWINLPGLPIDCWSSEGISIIASLVGKPMYTNKHTKTVDRMSSARILVELDVSKELVRSVEI